MSTSDSIEIWKPIEGWDGLYEISSLGRIRSLPRMAKTRSGSMAERKGRILKSSKAGGGYLGVMLQKPGKAISVAVHRCVLIAFLGNPRPGQEACHGPAGKFDNTLQNLSWGTKAKNGADRVRDGLLCGSKNPNALLTEEHVRNIRDMTGTHVAIAKMFEVTPELIGQIRNGRAWKHAEAFGADKGVRFSAPEYIDPDTGEVYQ